MAVAGLEVPPVHCSSPLGRENFTNRVMLPDSGEPFSGSPV